MDWYIIDAIYQKTKYCSFIDHSTASLGYTKSSPHTRQIIQDQGGDSRSPADLDPKGRETHWGKVNDVGHLFLCTNSSLENETHYERFSIRENCCLSGSFGRQKQDRLRIKNKIDAMYVSIAKKLCICTDVLVKFFRRS